VPFGVNHRYDLVLDQNGSFIRAQVKTGRLRDGVIAFRPTSVRANTKRAYTRGYEGEADVFLVYCPETDEVYAVPVSIAPRREMFLRVAPTLNGQTEGVHWAADYRLPA